MHYLLCPIESSVVKWQVLDFENTNVCFILLSELKADPSPAGPGVIVSCVLLKPGEVKKVKETNGFI